VFTKSATIYDAIYAARFDIDAAASMVHALIQAHKRTALKIARVLVSGREGNVSTLDVHYLVAQPEGVEHSSAHHRLGLFRHEEYVAAFREAGVDVMHEAEGLLGRGLYIGVRS
jgi:hypothetical protein